ncbi:MAG: Ig-like domain-containing protein [candidate division Zixibacteria bacterium]|nr:Ig-like domain-containing protein [candidate division Zixibacteria bacterium]
MKMAGKPFGQYVLYSAIVILLLSCAKSIAPPGGLIDRTPPDVLETIPITGSVNVPLDAIIEIILSEKIDSRSVERGIFITPQLNPEPKIKASGSKIIIEPKAPLKDNRTYVITLGTDIKDAHGVKLPQSINIAFSTGPTLDTGIITGVVFKDNKPARDISIALFESLPENTDTFPVDSLIPEYITQSGNDGRFEFNYIPPQNYYIVAFEDKNKNRRINTDREMIGIPSRTIVMDSLISEITGLNMMLSERKKKELGLKSISVNKDNLIKVRLTNAIDSLEMNSLFQSMTILDLPDKKTEVPYSSVSPLSPFPASDFVVLTDPLDTLLEYELQLDRTVINPTVDDSLKFMLYIFNGNIIDDKSKPVIVAMHPSDSQFNILPATDINFRFSEPVNIWHKIIEAELIQAADTMTVILTSEAGFYYAAKSAQSLLSGSNYIMRFDGNEIIDDSGNRFSDSLMSFNFTTIGADTLGHISGGIQYSSSDDAIFPVELTFNPVSGGVAKTIRIDRGRIEFIVDLLPGQYTISGYIDKNSNATFDFGAIIPYTLAEPFSAPADTFRVRSRFVTEDAVVEF